MDPQVIRAREERKKKKIEKQIRRLEKNASQLKPIDELEIPRHIMKDIQSRQRVNNISEALKEDRRNILKEWEKYKYDQHLIETKMIDGVLASQERALNELRKESEDLWFEAIQIDQSLTPFTFKGPNLTPPITDYESPDGQYIDKTKKYE